MSSECIALSSGPLRRPFVAMIAAKSGRAGREPLEG